MVHIRTPGYLRGQLTPVSIYLCWTSAKISILWLQPSLNGEVRTKPVSVISLKISPNIKRNYPLFCFQGRDKTRYMTQWGNLKQMVKNQEGGGIKIALEDYRAFCTVNQKPVHTQVTSLCMPHFLWASYCFYKFLKFPSIFGKWDYFIFRFTGDKRIHLISS